MNINIKDIIEKYNPKMKKRNKIIMKYFFWYADDLVDYSKPGTIQKIDGLGMVRIKNQDKILKWKMDAYIPERVRQRPLQKVHKRQERFKIMRRQLVRLNAKLIARGMRTTKFLRYDWMHKFGVMENCSRTNKPEVSRIKTKKWVTW